MRPYIEHGAHLQTGKPFGNFGGLRSREILANWLISAVMSTTGQGDFYFTTDPTGGDGIICSANSDQTWPTEHVLLPDLTETAPRPIEDRILDQINFKVDKGGAAYAGGKTLVVFLNAAGGAWYPNRVVRRLPAPLHFDTVWAVGLDRVEDGAYVYGVTNLHDGNGDAPAWRLTIAADFTSWTVKRIQ